METPRIFLGEREEALAGLTTDKPLRGRFVVLLVLLVPVVTAVPETLGAHQSLRILIAHPPARRGHTNTQCLLSWLSTALLSVLPSPQTPLAAIRFSVLPFFFSSSSVDSSPARRRPTHSLVDFDTDTPSLLRSEISPTPSVRQHEVHHRYRPCAGRRGRCLPECGQQWFVKAFESITHGRVD